MAFDLLFPSKQLPDDRTERYLDAIKDVYSDKMQMVVTILTTNRKDRYDAIKKICCLERPGEKVKFAHLHFFTCIPFEKHCMIK